MRIKIYSLVIVLCLIFASSFTLSSCVSLSSGGVTDVEVNTAGELVVFYSNGETQNLGVVSGVNGADGSNGSGTSSGATSQIVINGENNIPYASAKGLMSAVSIVCKFQATVQQGGWMPGTGSTSKEYTSSGSGVIYQIDKSAGDAFIITNYHVVYNASSNTTNGISSDISVYLYGSEVEEKAIKATYVGGSLYYDIAVLRIENSDVLKKSNATQVEISDSDKVCVGNSALAIGNAQGEGVSVSLGIVSVDSEYITMMAADEKTQVSFRVMRIDTAVNSGNSGGGLFDDKGCLIGIVNAKIVEDGVENIGYAIPSNVAVAIANNIIDYCYGTTVERVQRAFLGITLNATDSRAVFDSQTGTTVIKETVLVDEISNNSLADGVFQKGDILVSATFKEKTIEIFRQYHIIDMMLDVRAGDTVTINIIRGGEEKSVNITITENCLTAY